MTTPDVLTLEQLKAARLLLTKTPEQYKPCIVVSKKEYDRMLEKWGQAFIDRRNVIPSVYNG